MESPRSSGFPSWYCHFLSTVLSINFCNNIVSGILSAANTKHPTESGLHNKDILDVI